MIDFSVIISAYNKGRFITEAIHSVLNQTCQNFEIIIIDDGSIDNTRELVNSIKDCRIRYIYQENSGLPAISRNQGMSLSRGRCISFLDGDDFWHPEKLAKTKRVLDDNSDIRLVCHNEGVIYQDKVLRRTSFGPYVKDMYFRLLFQGNCLHPSAVTIRREVFFVDQMKFAEERDLCAIEDYEYWLRLAQKYRFYFLPDILGWYRVSDASIYLASAESNTTNLLKLLDGHFARFKPWNADLSGKIKKRRSAVMCAAGRIYQHKNNFQESKKWYTNAIKEYPFNYKAILGYIVAMLKVRIIYR